SPRQPLDERLGTSGTVDRRFTTHPARLLACAHRDPLRRRLARRAGIHARVREREVQARGQTGEPRDARLGRSDGASLPSREERGQRVRARSPILARVRRCGRRASRGTGTFSSGDPSRARRREREAMNASLESRSSTHSVQATRSLAGSSLPPLACLGLAALFLPFSNGITPMPLAAWLAPVFLLRHVRAQRARVGLPVAFALLAGAALIEFRGMMPGAGLAPHLIGAAFAVPAFVPYLFDRWITPRLDVLLGTFVFPSAWALVEYAMSLTPGATWGAIAYTQYGNLALLQMISVTGLWGLTFLI